MELAEAVALGVLDEHHGRVRDVDADLDHGRRDEHVRAAGGERLHRLLLLLRAHLAVHQDHAVVLELAAAQALELGRGRAGLQRLGLLHQRADHERLPARVELLADALVGPGALVVGRGDVGDDRAPAGGQLVQARDVEVAVGGERERARDRRRGHVQDVRRAAGRRLAVQLAALVDAEPVLLVHDRDEQAVELHRVLDQRVRADEDLQLAARQLAQQVGAARLRGGAGQQRGLHELTGHQLLQRREVLLGQRLRGRHQRGLAAGLDGAQHRVQRHDGLAGADLAHQQPLHRPVGRHVLVERGHRTRLVAGGRERERVAQPARGELAGGAQRLRPGALTAARPPAQERDLQQQELVEGQPSPAALLVTEVRGVDGRPAVRQAFERPDAGRQRLEHVAHLRALLVHERGDLHARQPVRRRVGGHVLPRRTRARPSRRAR